MPYPKAERFREQASKKVNSSKSPVLSLGSEKNLYPGEIQEIVIDILKDKLKNLPSGSRRADIISSLIEANKVSGQLEEVSRTVRAVFRGDYKFTDRDEADLKGIGIITTHEKKHYRLSLGGDARYTVTAASTASDVRAGANIASQILSTMY